MVQGSCASQSCGIIVKIFIFLLSILAIVEHAVFAYCFGLSNELKGKLEILIPVEIFVCLCLIVFVVFMIAMFTDFRFIITKTLVWLLFLQFLLSIAFAIFTLITKFNFCTHIPTIFEKIKTESFCDSTTIPYIVIAFVIYKLMSVVSYYAFNSKEKLSRVIEDGESRGYQLDTR